MAPSNREIMTLWRYQRIVVSIFDLEFRPPTLREAVRMLATLGGFLGRKCDGEPGSETLWRGLQRLDDIVQAYWLGRQTPAPGDGGDGRFG